MTGWQLLPATLGPGCPTPSGKPLKFQMSTHPLPGDRRASCQGQTMGDYILFWGILEKPPVDEHFRGLGCLSWPSGGLVAGSEVHRALEPPAPEVLEHSPTLVRHGRAVKSLGPMYLCPEQPACCITQSLTAQDKPSDGAWPRSPGSPDCSCECTVEAVRRPVPDRVLPTVLLPSSPGCDGHHMRM